jgi:hypothetical protein
MFILRLIFLFIIQLKSPSILWESQNTTHPLWWLNKKLYTVEGDLVVQVLVQLDSESYGCKSLRGHIYALGGVK